MTTANERLLDRAIAHSVDLARYSNDLVRRVIGILGRVDSRLAEKLTEVIEKARVYFRADRLASQLGEVRKINKAAYEAAANELSEELKEFAALEAEWQSKTLSDVLPEQITVAAVNAQQVAAAAMARPFQGVLLRGVLADVEAQTAKKIMQTIAQGIVEGRTTQQIVRDIRGSRALNYRDGLLERSRRDVENITRTAISHTAGVAQDEVMVKNAELIKAVKWSATLDLRTSEGCRIRDGKLYEPVDHKPIGHQIPWLSGPGRLHWNCRSASIPIVKSARELGIDLDLDLNVGTTRASLDGQVPKDTTYADWIKRQSFARQVEVLGETRAKLLKDGKLTMPELYSQKGEFLTLTELRQRNKAAFDDID